MSIAMNRSLTVSYRHRVTQKAVARAVIGDLVQARAHGINQLSMLVGAENVDVHNRHSGRGMRYVAGFLVACVEVDKSYVVRNVTRLLHLG